MRKFVSSFWTKMEFIWRIFFSTSLSVGYITAVYLTYQAHYDFLDSIVEMSKSTTRIGVIIGGNENIHR